MRSAKASRITNWNNIYATNRFGDVTLEDVTLYGLLLPRIKSTGHTQLRQHVAYSAIFSLNPPHNTLPGTDWIHLFHSHTTWRPARQRRLILHRTPCHLVFPAHFVGAFFELRQIKCGCPEGGWCGCVCVCRRKANQNGLNTVQSRSKASPRGEWMMSPLIRIRMSFSLDDFWTVVGTVPQTRWCTQCGTKWNTSKGCAWEREREDVSFCLSQILITTQWTVGYLLTNRQRPLCRLVERLEKCMYRMFHKTMQRSQGTLQKL